MRTDKMGRRAIEGVLVGYGPGNAYRVYVKSKNKVFIERDVDCLEAASKSENMKIWKVQDLITIEMPGLDEPSENESSKIVFKNISPDVEDTLCDES